MGTLAFGAWATDLFERLAGKTCSFTAVVFISATLITSPLAAQTLRRDAYDGNNIVMLSLGPLTDSQLIGNFRLEWSTDQFATVAGSEAMSDSPLLTDRGVSLQVGGLRSFVLYQFRASADGVMPPGWRSNIVDARPVPTTASAFIPAGPVITVPTIVVSPTTTPIQKTTVSWTPPSIGKIVKIEYSTSAAFPGSSTGYITSKGSMAALPLVPGVTSYIRAYDGFEHPFPGHPDPKLGGTTLYGPPSAAVSAKEAFGVLPPPTLYVPGVVFGVVTVRWAPVSGATFYRVSRVDTSRTGLVLLGWVDVAESSYRTPDLGQNVSVAFLVQSCSSAGCGPLSRKVSAVTESSEALY